MRFPAKITSSYRTCMLIELFYIGTPVVRTDGRSVGQGGGGVMNGRVITEFSRIGRST